MFSGSGTQTRLSQAVLDAGVKYYIPWQFGVNYDVIGREGGAGMFSEQLDVRDMLRNQSTTKWTIISTGMFMSFVFEDAFGVVSADKSEVRSLGDWENEVTVTSAEDIGRLTAEIVFAEPKLYDQVVYTAGDTVSYAQVADILEEVYGNNVKRVSQTLQSLKEASTEDSADLMKRYRVVFAEGRGVAWPKDTSFNSQNGIRTENMKQWLEQRSNK
jgi:hypothetical protein